jgi:hypothetical protein
MKTWRRKKTWIKHYMMREAGMGCREDWNSPSTDPGSFWCSTSIVNYVLDTCPDECMMRGEGSRDLIPHSGSPSVDSGVVSTDTGRL